MVVPAAEARVPVVEAPSYNLFGVIGFGHHARELLPIRSPPACSPSYHQPVAPSSPSTSRSPVVGFRGHRARELLPSLLLPIRPPAARPFFSVAGHKMENHRNLRDFLSQGCSSSTFRNRTGHEAPDDDDFGTFSQSSFALPPRINVPALHSRIEALDLNSQSQGTDFPYLSSYKCNLIG
jgi:hypothetical protein